MTRIAACFGPAWLNDRVLFNGVRVADCFQADDVEGWVDILVDRGDRIERRYGRVEFLRLPIGYIPEPPK